MFHAPKQQDRSRARKRFAKWQIDLAIHQAVAIAGKRSLDQPFQRLLSVAVSRSNLLRTFPPTGRATWTHAEPILRGLLALCTYRKNWLRDAENWRPKQDDPRSEFAALARYLLARHPVPQFMTQVWFEPPGRTATAHQKLFKHLALGNSIQGTALPISLSKSMAGYFAQAPDHLTVEQAVRWSQVRGLGGHEELAAATVATRLGRVFKDERFWLQALRFLIAQHKLDLAMLPPIVDYLIAYRGGLVTGSVHKVFRRSYGSLVGRVRKWMEHSPHYRRTPRLQWAATPIAGFRYVEPPRHEWSVRYWTIRELTDSDQLTDEGNNLHHCVAGYAGDCAQRYTSIWSLRCHGSLESRRVLTIEVVPDERRIVTALGKCNTAPKRDARRVMQMWAENEGLTIGKWV